MSKLVYTLVFILFSTGLIAQVPTDQDCLGAIPVCQDVYEQLNSYSGEGNYPNEIPNSGGCPGNCMLSGEKNDVWYIFTVQSDGNVSFVITPNNPSDDYDWAVYSLNHFKCEDIYTHVNQMQVSCNWSGISGPTGANGNSSLNCQGGGGSPYNATIPVFEGQTYVINISNYSSSQSGYRLDLSESTAVIYDDVAPELANVQNQFLECGLSELTFSFSEQVLCSSVQRQDFDLDGPGGPYEIESVVGEACQIGGMMESTYTIGFSPPIYASGTYTLSLNQLNFIQDLCGNDAAAQSLEFTLDLDSPEADAGEDIEIQFLTSTSLDGSVVGGSGNYSYAWTPEDKLVDPFVEDPTTVVLSQSTEYTMSIVDENSGCQASDKVWVNVVGGEMSLVTQASPMAVCALGQSDLSTSPSGGSGDYTYTWTSEPPGFSSDIQNPSVFPEVTTTYFVEVDDGFSTVNDEVTVSVYPNPVADAGPDQVINIGTQAQLDGSATDGAAPYSFLWEPASMLSGPNDIANPTTIPLGSPQNYTLFVADANLCESEPSVVLINATGEELSAYPQAEPPEICIGGSTVIDANATGGAHEYTYLWTSSNDPDWTQTADTVEVSPTETTTYFVEVDDGFETYTAHIVVTVHSLPEVDILPQGYFQHGDDTIMVCVRDTVVLDAGNENNPLTMQYQWSNSWAQRYFVAKTNGNWYDIQDFKVTVRNLITTCQNTDSLTIVFDFNQCEIGVDERPLTEHPVNIYPNPTNGMMYLKSDERINRLYVKVMSLEGKTIMEKEFESIHSGNWEYPLDLSELNKGVYMVLIQADGRVYALKAVKN